MLSCVVMCIRLPVLASVFVTKEDVLLRNARHAEKNAEKCCFNVLCFVWLLFLQLLVVVSLSSVFVDVSLTAKVCLVQVQQSLLLQINSPPDN